VGLGPKALHRTLRFQGFLALAQGPGIRYSRSEFFRRPLPTDVAAALARSVLADRVPGHTHEVDLIPWGGAYNRVPHQRLPWDADALLAAALAV
jgi:hypothetical protein